MLAKNPKHAANIQKTFVLLKFRVPQGSILGPSGIHLPEVQYLIPFYVDDV